MDQTPERITYSVKEAAAALGVSEWMVREEIRVGRIDSVRFGARILIPRQALERLLGNSGQTDDKASAAPEEAHHERHYQATQSGLLGNPGVPGP